MTTDSPPAAAEPDDSAIAALVLMLALLQKPADVHGGDKPGHWIVGDVPMRAV